VGVWLDQRPLALASIRLVLGIFTELFVYRAGKGHLALFGAGKVEGC